MCVTASSLTSQSPTPLTGVQNGLAAREAPGGGRGGGNRAADHTYSLFCLDGRSSAFFASAAPTPSESSRTVIYLCYIYYSIIIPLCILYMGTVSCTVMIQPRPQTVKCVRRETRFDGSFSHNVLCLSGELVGRAQRLESCSSGRA